MQYQQSKLVESIPNSTQPSQAPTTRHEAPIDARDSSGLAHTIISHIQLPKKKQEEFKLADINIFQPRDKNYKIISNRIRILARKEQKRRYVHKDQKQYEQTFDPIRTKLRVMPIERAPQIQGKTADFYFIQAGKLCLRNNLTHAIE